MPVDDHRLYDADDPGETANRVGSRAEHEAIELLRHALTGIDAPAHQLARLGLE